MKKSILDTIIESRKGHYCHVVECTYVYELECIVESIISEFSDTHTMLEITDFFTSLSVYFLENEELNQQENSTLENELYAFNFTDYIGVL